MDTYAIFRRNLATPEDLATVDERSQSYLDAHPDEVRKIRSYVFEEEDGRLGTICVYQATGVDAIERHRNDADVAFDEIRRLTTIDVHRPDPDPLTT